MASIRKQIRIDANPDDVWDAVRDFGAPHYNASVQVFPDGGTGTRVEWVVDVLPDGVRDFLDEVMDQGALAMKRALSVA